MLCPTRFKPPSMPCFLKKCARSSAMAVYVCGSAWGEAPWFRRSYPLC